MGGAFCCSWGDASSLCGLAALFTHWLLSDAATRFSVPSAFTLPLKSCGKGAIFPLVHRFHSRMVTKEKKMQMTIKAEAAIGRQIGCLWVRVLQTSRAQQVFPRNFRLFWGDKAMLAESWKPSDNH
ncbi:hypothetical protein E2320_013609, partial [Naja naja]